MFRPRSFCFAALVLVPLFGAACSSGADDRSEEHYCTEVGNRIADLNSPTLGTTDEIRRTLGSWKVVAAAAPLAVEAEWDQLIGSLETAVTVDPSDTASLQKVADTARSAEPAANRIIDYTYKICGAVIGPVTPVTTTPAQVPATAP